MGFRLNLLDEPVIMAGAKHLLIEFSIQIGKLCQVYFAAIWLQTRQGIKRWTFGRSSQKIHLVSIGLVTPMFLRIENQLTVFAKLS